MDMIYKAVELAATFTENTVFISSVLVISGHRFKAKKQILLTGVSAVLLSVFVAWMNSIESFSFLTPICSMLIITFIISKFLSKERLLCRAMACVVTIFVIQTIDYLLIIAMAFSYGSNFDSAFQVFITPGSLRSVYLLINKLIDVVLLLLLFRKLPKLAQLNTKLLTLLFIASIIIYGTMQYLFGVVLYGDFYALHISSVIFFLLLLCFLVALIFMLFAVASSEKARTANRLLEHNNLFMEKNYRQLHEDIRMNAKRVHDFNHHLGAIRSMADFGNSQQITSYVDSLLEISFKEIELCHSGNDIIDAVINCKSMEAKECGINLSYDVKLARPINICSVDLCAVLSNQIANAFDACLKIEDESDRIIKIDLFQKGDVAIFKVSNRVIADPFIDNEFLLSTKTDKALMHGLGLKNIRDIAKKHDGSLRCTFTEGFFISTVFLNFLG